MKNYMILDIETEGYDYRQRFCDPLEFENNTVVMIQLIYDGEGVVKVLYRGGADLRNISLDFTAVDIIVGHNIKFDLLYLWKNKSIQEFLLRGGKIWDTQTADYLINHCRTDIRYNLNAVAERYKLGSKYSPIMDLYKGDSKAKIKPMTTMEIIEKEGINEFKKYAEQDVILTEQIFLKQLEYDKTDLIKDYMDYYVTLIETEFNGLSVDRKALDQDYRTKTAQLMELENCIVRGISPIWKAFNTPFCITSNDHLSLLLFGGELKETVKVATGVYKTGAKKGQIKYKNENNITPIKPAFPLKYAKPLKKVGFYKVDSSVLEELAQTPSAPSFVEDILDFKRQNKLLIDIEKKIKNNINPYTGCLHSEFKTTSTATGRLSSGNPGSQNLHPSTLQYFTSRGDKPGIIVEADWNQVEVCTAAYLFDDAVLKEEILNGVDLHLQNAMTLTGKPADQITKEDRRTAKFMTFGILYGQTEYGLSKTHGVSESEAKQFINAFYDKYSGIRNAHTKLERLFNQSYSSAYDLDPNFLSKVLVIPTNKKSYFFRTWEKGFKPAQYKNYIIQGGAGDLHAHCVGALRQWILTNRDWCVMINNIHDSILFDVELKYCEVHNFTFKLKRMLEKLAKEYTGTELFTVDVKSGKSWADCKNG